MTDASVSREPTLRTAVEQCLRGFGYPCVIDSDGIDVRFACRTERGTWRSQFLIDEGARVLQLVVFVSDAGYPARRERWISELVYRMNEAVAVLGNFTVQWGSGAVLFRHAIDLRRRTVDAEIVEDMLNSLAFPLDVWHRAYEHVHSAQVSPAAALDAARISANVYDEDDVSETTRRALLTVVDGAAGALSETAGSADAEMRPPLTLI